MQTLTDEALKLNIGSGNVELDGFVNIDRKDGGEAYPLRMNKGTKVADQSVDEIRASHILEHFSFKEVGAVLREWFRSLRPGGLLRVSVPDFDKIKEMAEGGQNGDGQWFRYLMGGQIDSDDYHKSCFTESLLRQSLVDAGFMEVKPWDTDGRDTSAHQCSLNLQAKRPTKQDLAEGIDLRIAAVMSIPRVGWNDNWHCVVNALRPFGIPVRTVSGAFWGQCLQNAFESCVDDDLDWIMTIDYDSVFTAQHVDEMFGLFGNNPHIDALAALQCRRSMSTDEKSETPLLTIRGKREIEITGDPIRVDTAHFGLTLIRVEALRQIPKPWFKGEPGEGGSWTHYSRLDPDIWFWHQWKIHQKSVYIAPTVRIGHLQLMVSEFDEKMNARHIFVQDWRDREGIKRICKR